MRSSRIFNSKGKAKLNIHYKHYCSTTMFINLSYFKGIDNMNLLKQFQTYKLKLISTKQRIVL